MKKRVNFIVMFILIIVTVATIFLLKPKQEPAVSAIKETIKLPILISGGDASWESCIEEVAKEYMQLHSEVEIEVRASSNNTNMDFNKGMIIEEALGNFNGIVEMRNANLYSKENKIVPLPQELIETIKFVKKIDGEVYSLPRFYTCRGIIYNKKIFERLQLEEPKTYQEFLDLCETLKENRISPLVIGAGDRWHLNNWINGLFTKNVKREYPDWINLRNQGQVHWKDEQTKKILKDFVFMFQQGYVNKNYKTVSDAQTIEFLIEEKAAMLFSGNWMFSQILKVDPDFEIGWFFLPDEFGEAIIETGENVGWSITSSCAKDAKMYEAAVDFLEFYYQEDNYKKVLQNMNGISVLKNDIEYNSIQIQTDIIKQVKEKGKPEGITLGGNGTPEGFMNSMYDNILNLVEGSASIDETLDQLDKEWDKYLEESE